MKTIGSLFYSTLLLLFAGEVSAQNNIAAVRYDDDFSQLKNDSVKKGLDRLKYISLGGSNFVSFGGELREQFQSYDNINFGDVPSTYPSSDAMQLWHRANLHASIELGIRWRFFLQLQNTLRLLNDNPAVPEIDENQLALHQAFAELKLNGWNFRLGQQELFYGNHRLITFREGPNTRLAFDGLVIKRKFADGRIDFFAVSKVVSKRYAFDDESMHDGLLGIYGTQFFSNRKIGLDYYLVNFQSRSRQYNYQPGFENRETCGARFFTDYDVVNFEFEAAYQTGKFNDLDIEAYSVTADVNIIILPKIKAVVGFSASVASGDKDSDDDKLNTYNLLYAKPAYGLAAPIGASNMVSFNPYLKIMPVRKLNVLAQAFFLSRQRNRDGTYSPGMVQNRPHPGALYGCAEKKLGQLYVLETAYQLNKNLTFSFDGSYFKAGSYPKATGNGNDILYLSFKTVFKF